MERRRRLGDLLLEYDFLEVQLEAIRDSGPPHLVRARALRIARLRNRLAEIERQLRALTAEVLPADPFTHAKVRQWARDRRGQADPTYDGPERRVALRRRDDATRGERSAESGRDGETPWADRVTRARGCRGFPT